MVCRAVMHQWFVCWFWCYWPFACSHNFLTCFLFVYFFIYYRVYFLRMNPLRFGAGCCKRQINLVYFSCLTVFCVSVLCVRDRSSCYCSSVYFTVSLRLMYTFCGCFLLLKKFVFSLWAKRLTAKSISKNGLFWDIKLKSVNEFKWQEPQEFFLRLKDNGLHSWFPWIWKLGMQNL